MINLLRIGDGKLSRSHHFDWYNKAIKAIGPDLD
ncbi:hypothetical protein JOE23_002971 [Amphibacillus cookii]|nr:hypothetical protein [Amphibacillus cookii]